MRAGMDRDTGRILEGWEHCAQSIAVILTTRIGWRVMRRSFGSELRALQDRNPDPATMLSVFSAIASAVRRWEPGFRLVRIMPDRIGADGTLVMTLTGTFYPRGHLGDYSLAEDRSAAYGGSTTGFRLIGATA